MEIICRFLILLSAILLYCRLGYLIINRTLTNKICDKKFNINTVGIRNWDKNNLYHRTESTPYLALDSLVKEYTVNLDDNLVDFGAGRGRVSIYLFDKWKVAVKGIEINDFTYVEFAENISNYFSKHGDSNDLDIVKEYAENYKIKEGENKFFFFNPFNVSIFEKVIENIIANAIKNNKEVEIILYYPTNEYKSFLKETPFKLIQEIKTKNAIFPNERFAIYKYTP